MMAVQIGMQGFHSGPRMTTPHSFLQPANFLPQTSVDFPPQSPTATTVSNISKTLAVTATTMTTTTPSTTANSTTTTSSGGGQTGTSFDGRRMRSKTAIRRTVDYNSSIVNWLHNRVWQRDKRDTRTIQPEAIYNYTMVPPSMLLNEPINSLATRSVRAAMNKVKCPIFCTCWTPEGRRLVTGASSGEFTLWNGLTFSFETILQAHDTSVRAMVWSHNDTWMLTADHGGFVKYWQSNMNNVKMYQAHKDPVRGLSFCPLDQKFASCSDDGTVRIWDFLRCHEERILRGHGADVKCVDWHPLKGLVVSGSKDTQQPVKLWDPRTGNSLATIHAHKHTVMDLKWNSNGNWLLTASRDHLVKIFDLRNMKEEMQSFRGHKKEATTLAWHPIHECLFASGGSDGAIMFWLVGNDKELGSIDEAHETMVWSMSWHPLGHILVSGSNDHTTKFWTRNRPGDTMRDRYNLNTLPAGMPEDLEYDFEPNVPGLGQEFGVDNYRKGGIDNGDFQSMPAIPGLDLSPEKSSLSNYGISGNFVGDNKFSRRKAIYTKPVPKDFERAWTEGLQPTAITSGGMRDIPEDHMHQESIGMRPNFDGRGPGTFDGMRNPYKWQGPMRQPGPDHPDHSDEMPPPPMQGFPGPCFQGPGPMPPRMGPRGPMPPQMLQRMHNPNQSMMPPHGPPMRGHMGPPGSGGPHRPQGPPPLLSLSFNDHQNPGGVPPQSMGPGGINDNLHLPPGERFSENMENFENQNNEYCGEDEMMMSDPNDPNLHREMNFHHGNPNFGRPEGMDPQQMHDEQFHMPGPPPDFGGWRRPRGGPHMGPPDIRNQGPPPNNEPPFQNRNKPPSLLDMRLEPCPPPPPPMMTMGGQRNWEGGEDGMDFGMPQGGENHPHPNQFPSNQDLPPTLNDTDISGSWPEDQRPPPNISRGRGGDFFRGGRPGRGKPRGRGLRGGRSR